MFIQVPPHQTIGSITINHHLDQNSCMVKLPLPIFKNKGKTGMVEETPHVKQLYLNLVV
jgi:hypothetical protein